MYSFLMLFILGSLAITNSARYKPGKEDVDFKLEITIGLSKPSATTEAIR